MKRAIDVVLTLPILVLIAPLLVLFSLAILALEGRPVFFIQNRVGKDQRRFRMFKFRTMRNAPAGANAGDAPAGATPEQLKALRARYETTSAGDSRVTPIGRLMRKTSIDELPQLINVVKGDMSLVGPRPSAPVQEADYPPADWRERHLVRPGITGLAQVSGRSAISPAQTMTYDLQYVRTPGVGLYFTILVRTFLQVIRLGGGNT